MPLPRCRQRIRLLRVKVCGYPGFERAAIDLTISCLWFLWVVSNFLLLQTMFPQRSRQALMSVSARRIPRGGTGWAHGVDTQPGQAGQAARWEDGLYPLQPVAGPHCAAFTCFAFPFFFFFFSYLCSQMALRRS